MCLREEEDGSERAEGKGSLYFSTSCLFSCVLIVRGGMKCTLVVCSIESGCESHIWFGNLSGVAPQMVHLQTA